MLSRFSAQDNTFTVELGHYVTLIMLLFTQPPQRLFRVVKQKGTEGGQRFDSLESVTAHLGRRIYYLLHFFSRRKDASFRFFTLVQPVEGARDNQQCTRQPPLPNGTPLHLYVPSA